MQVTGAVVEACEGFWLLTAYTRTGWVTWLVWEDGSRTLIESVDVSV